MAASRHIPRSSALWNELAARLRQPRRVTLAVLVGIAVVGGIDAARPTPTPTRAVWVAARDLSGGAPLSAGDLRTERLAVADVPAGALTTRASPIGRLLAAPVRRGEPVTDVRLLSPSLLTALDVPNAVAVSVRVADGPAALALVHTGDVVDVIATPDTGDGTPVDGSAVVHDVRVLAIPTHPGAAETDDGAGLLIVAGSPRQAAALARAATGARLSIAVRRPA